MRFVWMMQIALVLLAPSAITAYAVRHDPPRAVRRAGLVLAATYVGLVGAFVVGETFTDPGGWAAARLVALWLVPMTLASALAWRTSDGAQPLLAWLVVAMAGLYLWSAFAPDAWRNFEDGVGPVRGIATLALTAPLAVLGRDRPREAGWLLVGLGAMPPVTDAALRLVGEPGIALSLAVLDAPVLVVGVLLVVADHLAQTRGRAALPRGSGRAPGPPRPAH